ncbi:MAG: FMN-binding protein [Oscillospiraceae bacterium]|nr:FMN-binding protein [Oscillospiraceae bacterium]
MISLLLAAAMLAAAAGCAGNGSSSSEGAETAYADGVYEAQMPEYEYGWKEYGRITVENGVITKVEYDGISESGALKSQDEAYKTAMSQGNEANGLPGVYPEQAYAQLLESFRESYDASEVETVAGATTSSGNFARIMGRIMEMVEDGEPGAVTLSAYVDGTYEVEMPEYDNGWKEYLIVAVRDGEVSAVEFDAKNEAGELRSADEEYKNSMTAAGSETWPEDYSARLEENYLKAGSTDEMEMVAGATTSSQNFKKLMRRAMNNAKNGVTGLQTAPEYEDGKYRAEMAKEDQGWKEFVEITIQDGKIAEVVFDVVDADGNYKSADEEYKKKMAEGGSETWPEKFYAEILAEYQAKNYLAKDMELVAGATVSSENFQMLAPAALQRAKLGDSAVMTVEVQ